MSLQQVFEYNFINIGDFQLNLFQLVIAIIVLAMGRFFIWLLERLATQYFKKKNVDRGRQYALQQFIKYIVYTCTLLMALEAVGISLSLLWGGAAALLVGIGLGLQDTFNNLLSGIILLLEGTVEMGDIIEVDDTIGSVVGIGIRTSTIETRDRISILIPNSKIVGDKAINWSHNSAPTRFQIQVGVAYASDIDLTTELLLDMAKNNPTVLRTPSPEVQFRDFGNSSLDFILYFYSTEYLRIEFIKSELRYNITRAFRKHNIEIPFPQHDLWLRSAVTST